MTTMNQVLPDSYERLKSEIKRGLVLRLDPEKMKLWGATCKTEDIYQIRQPHYFACIGVGYTNDQSFWVPMSSHFKPGRTYVGYGDKRGGEILGRRNDLYLEESSLGGKSPRNCFLSGIGGEKA